MKIPESLPWEIKPYENMSGNSIVSPADIDHVAVDVETGDAEYIIKAANMLPEVLEGLKVIDEYLSHGLEEEAVNVINELLAKVKED